MVLSFTNHICNIELKIIKLKPWVFTISCCKILIYNALQLNRRLLQVLPQKQRVEQHYHVVQNPWIQCFLLLTIETWHNEVKQKAKLTKFVFELKERPPQIYWNKQSFSYLSAFQNTAQPSTESPVRLYHNQKLCLRIFILYQICIYCLYLTSKWFHFHSTWYHFGRFITNSSTTTTQEVSRITVQRQLIIL